MLSSIPDPVPELSQSKSILLAAHYASSANLKALCAVISHHPATLCGVLLLRVLLCLPETTNPELYIPLIKYAISCSDGVPGEIAPEVSASPVTKISDKTAHKRVQQLVPQFSTVVFEQAPHNHERDNPLLSFLVHRSRNIDRETGALSIVVELLSPFRTQLPGVESYLTGIVGVLSRLVYEHGAEERELPDEMRRLAVFDGLRPRAAAGMLLTRCGNSQTVVSDLARLVGPYLDAKGDDNEGWEVVWEWLQGKATGGVGGGSWGEFVEIVTKWGGPLKGDALKGRYAGIAIAGCYVCRDTGPEAWEGMRAIHRRCKVYLDGAKPKSGDQRAPGKLGDPFDKDNPLTTPDSESLGLLDVLITSAAILSVPLASVAEIKMEASHDDQKTLLVRHVRNGPNWTKRSDDEWRKMRDGVKWLQTKAKVLGKLTARETEKILLASMLASTRFALVKEIYISGRDCDLGKDDVERGILDTFQEFYDNASNGNKTRGSMRNALGALQIWYPDHSKSIALQRAFRLVSATHALSHYSLILTPGIPLLPVQIRIHPDPISLIARLLDSNSKSYVQAESLISVAKDLCFGTSGNDGGRLTDARVLGMCIEAALSESDFETAYSFAINRLVSMVDESEQSINEGVGDVIWRACFQAGRDRSPYTALVGETTAHGGKALRTVEMRMELLAQALRFCPPPALAEVLASWWRCEEEMLAGLREEEEEEEKQEMYWNPVGGGARPTGTVSKRREDETPMGLFAVAAGAAKALRGTAFPLAADRGAVAAENESVIMEEQRTRKRDMVSGMVTSGLASGLGWVLGAQPNIDKR